MLVYEAEKRAEGWNTEQIYSYNWHGVPRILNHLNQQREQFRDNFPLCLVFLLPRFAIDYFIHRCPDFYDWRSGSFQISSDDDNLRETLSEIYNWALSLNPQERQQEILNIQSQLKHQSLPLPDRANLSYKQGILLEIDERYSEAIASYDKALEIQPDDHEAWLFRGNAMSDLQGYSEEIASEQTQALVKEIRQSRGFRLLFVQCSPQKGQEVIENVTEEFPQKKISVLSLDKAIDKLYPLVKAYQDQEVLFIKGLEQSLLVYEAEKRAEGWNTEEIYSYSWHGVPRILNHLNQQREQFRENFPLCFVFLLPRFAIDYFIHRCADFYDWRSGFFQLSSDDAGLRETLSEVYNWALSLNPQERQKEILNIRSQLKHQSLPLSDIENLSYKQDILLEINELYSESIAYYDKALELKPDDHEAWYNRGNALSVLKRYREAIDSYDKALEIKPDDHEAWLFRGNALGNLQRYSEAIASYEKALEIQADYHEAWLFRGYVLHYLQRYSEAIDSYDKALEIKPDYYEAWYNRGNALYYLQRYSEEIDSYEKALEIQPDDHETWYDRGIALSNLQRYSEAIDSYDKALEIKPDNHETWFYRGNAMSDLQRYSEAIASYDKALEIKPDDYQALYNRGNALHELQRYSEAIASYDKALEIKPDYHEAWYNRGNTLYYLQRYSEAIASYDKALEIKPNYHLGWNNRGIAWSNLQRYSEAIASYDKALKIKPVRHEAWYNKACCYALQGQIELAIQNLDKAIQLNQESREMAETDSDFDKIRADVRFQKLLES